MAESYTGFKIVLDDPVQSGDGASTHVTYGVVTDAVRSGSNETEKFSVRRRYNDFVDLRSKLQDKFPLVMLPALPPATVVAPGMGPVFFSTKDFSPEFIEKRRRGLQAFLSLLVAHPTLHDSPDIISFLKEESGGGANATSKKISKFFGKLESKFSTRVDNMTSKGAAAVIAGGSDQAEAEARSHRSGSVTKLPSDYFTKLSEQMDNAGRIAHNMSEREFEVALHWSDLSGSYKTLGDAVNKENPAWPKLGDCSTKMAQLSRSLATVDELQLAEFMRLWSRHSEAGAEWVSENVDNAQMNYETAWVRLDTNKKALETAKPTDVSKLEGNVSQSHTFKEEARKRKENAERAFDAELVHFDAVKLDAWRKVLAVYTRSNITYHQRAKAAWEEVDASLVGGGTDLQEDMQGAEMVSL